MKIFSRNCAQPQKTRNHLNFRECASQQGADRSNRTSRSPGVYANTWAVLGVPLERYVTQLWRAKSHEIVSNQKSISRPALIIQTSRSIGFVVYVILLHSLTALVVCLTPKLSFAIAALLCLMISLNARAMLEQHPPATLIIWHANNQIQFRSQRAFNNHDFEQQTLNATLAQGSTHNRLYILLHLKQNSHGNRRWLIARDAVSDRDFRRIRARLNLDNSLSLIDP